MHRQLGIRLLFEELVVVEAWWEAKRKGDQKATKRRKGNLEKANSHVVELGLRSTKKMIRRTTRPRKKMCSLIEAYPNSQESAASVDRT